MIMKLNFEKQPINVPQTPEKDSINSINSIDTGKQEELENSEIPVLVQKTRELLNKCKDYLKSKSFNLKFGVSFLLIMGTIVEVTQAEGNDFKMNNLKNKIEEATTKNDSSENLVDGIYSSYKKANIDSTFSILEYKNLTKDGKIIERENKGHKLSGRTLSLDNQKDTISLGNVEVKSFSIYMFNQFDKLEESKMNLNGESEFRFISGIKPNVAVNDSNSPGSKEVYINYGEDPKELVIAGLAMIAEQRRSYVSSIYKHKFEHKTSSTPVSGKSESFKSSAADLSTVESDEIIKGVKIVVKEITTRKEKKDIFGGNTIKGKKARRHNKGLNKEDKIQTRIKNKDIPKKYYSAKIIYNKFNYTNRTTTK